jgi:hypothetical protein
MTPLGEFRWNKLNPAFAIFLLVGSPACRRQDSKFLFFIDQEHYGEQAAQQASLRKFFIGLEHLPAGRQATESRGDAR